MKFTGNSGSIRSLGGGLKTAKCIIAVMALLTVASPAQAANWIYMTESKSGTVFYYDPDTIVYSGNQVTVWERWDHTRDKDTQHRTTLMRTRYDCTSRTYTHLHAIMYFPDGSNKIIKYSPYEQQQETMIAPGTNGDANLKMLCEVR